jgi:hypothetical protein
MPACFADNLAPLTSPELKTVAMNEVANCGRPLGPCAARSDEVVNDMVSEIEEYDDGA